MGLGVGDVHHSDGKHWVGSRCKSTGMPRFMPNKSKLVSMISACV